MKTVPSFYEAEQDQEFLPEYLPELRQGVLLNAVGLPVREARFCGKLNDILQPAWEVAISTNDSDYWYAMSNILEWLTVRLFFQGHNHCARLVQRLVEQARLNERICPLPF